jgi:hypothetical protein
VEYVIKNLKHTHVNAGSTLQLRQQHAPGASVKVLHKNLEVLKCYTNTVQEALGSDVLTYKTAREVIANDLPNYNRKRDFSFAFIECWEYRVPAFGADGDRGILGV